MKLGLYSNRDTSTDPLLVTARLQST